MSSSGISPPAMNDPKGSCVKRKVFASLVVVLSLCQCVFAQVDRAVVRGRVIDAKQLPIAGVEVRLFHKATNELRVTATGNEGDFVFASLAPGSYRLEVEQPGQRKYTQDVDLFVNQE